MMKNVCNTIASLLNKRRDIKRDIRNKSLPWSISLSLGAKNDIKDIILENKIYITKARQYLPFNNNEFNRFVLPIIEYIAKYYLYLPSCNDHHRHAGGAFLHSIHSALYTASLIERSSEIYRDIDGEYRRMYESTSPLAVFIFALLHDTGKYITDHEVYVCDKKGTIDQNIKSWDPTKETIHDWLKINKVQYYRVQNSPKCIANKYKIHTLTSLSKLDHILDTFSHPKLLKDQLYMMHKNFGDGLTQEMLKFVEVGRMLSIKFYMDSH
ncbi:TraI domain-containing protein [Colwellia sp. BRX8-4]|jgi:hypothetical protein|uniref:TraI domain-containing protein n=1 Tax=Colwellia sp. BRX8-4 TaxID=2759836 RepID=UPI0015F72110|nr:TraI domain-containing protein [Colwellia sp. BRX8-4]MBA6371500.1 TraI domain-containing protein [Colwellia sp. BRX8-4]